MKTLIVAVLATLVLVPCAPARADDGALMPFVAEYAVHYGSMTVGKARTELRRAPMQGRWTIETVSNARGLAKLLVGSTVVQRSDFSLDGMGVRPIHYSLDDGTSETSDDIVLDFDWLAGRVRGVAEDEPVDVPAEPGLQDAGSIQAQLLWHLLAGTPPGDIAMIEKDYVKRYRCTLLRRERLATAIGNLETVVYRSAREGSRKETIYWYAPSLGFAMVRMENRRDGKVGFNLHIRRYDQNG